jgi:NmrA-like family
LDALCADSGFTVSVLSRKSSTSTFPSHITVHRVDDLYPEDELLGAFTGRHAIVCALNLQNVHQQIKFIDVAVQAGVKWFVPAEFGGNKEAAKHGERLPLHEAKIQVSEHLAKMEKEGLSWTAVATGPFIDW